MAFTYGIISRSLDNNWQGDRNETEALAGREQAWIKFGCSN